MSRTVTMTPDATQISADGIRRFYNAFIQGNIDEATTMVTPEFLMHVPGNGQNAGEYWGREGLRICASNIRNYNGGIFTLRVNAFAVNGDNAFTRERITLNRRLNPDRKWDLRFVMHYRMRNGLISEAWTIPEDLYAYDEYWTPHDMSAVGGSAASVLDSSDFAHPAADSALSGEVDSPSSLKLLLSLYQCFWDGAYEQIQPLLVADVVFHAVGRGYLSGSYVGFQGWLSFREKLMAIAGDKYKLEIDAIAAGPTDVFVKEYIRMNTANDPRVVTEYVIMHFRIRGGKIAVMNDVPIDLYAWERFFSAGSHLV